MTFGRSKRSTGSCRFPAVRDAVDATSSGRVWLRLRRLARTPESPMSSHKLRTGSESGTALGSGAIAGDDNEVERLRRELAEVSRRLQESERRRIDAEARLATPDLQWIGNENGQASRTTSSLDTIYCGGGNTWCPFE